MMEAQLKAGISSLEVLNPIAAKLGPEAQKTLGSLLTQLNDPNAPLTEKLAKVEAGQKAIANYLNLGMQEQEKQQQMIATNAAYTAAQQGGNLPLVLSPEVRARAIPQMLAMQEQQAKIDATRTPKLTEMVWPTQEAARAAGVQANPGFDIKVNPTKGGWTFNAVEKPQPQPNPAAAAIVAAQVPIIQASFEAAEGVPSAIESIHKQKDLINSGEVPTGILAPVQTYIDRLGALLGNKSSEAAAARTAEYDKLLNQATFDAMKASGLKASQLNTEKEWERFNQAIAASRSNPKEAALAILDLNEKAQRALLDKHNKKLKSGVYKPFLENSQISYSPIEQPPAYQFKGNAKPADFQPAAGGNVIRTYDPVTGTLK
ncbi:MAG: hypothetical protein EBR82_82105 [Caulobacteraceae bacterium]|nr:hypothetical protein [Caulobacteraceae bacterium]